MKKRILFCADSPESYAYRHCKRLMETELDNFEIEPFFFHGIQDDPSQLLAYLVSGSRPDIVHLSSIAQLRALHRPDILSDVLKRTKLTFAEVMGYLADTVFTANLEYPLSTEVLPKSTILGINFLDNYTSLESHDFSEFLQEASLQKPHAYLPALIDRGLAEIGAARKNSRKRPKLNVIWHGNSLAADTRSFARTVLSPLEEFAQESNMISNFSLIDASRSNLGQTDMCATANVILIQSLNGVQKNRLVDAMVAGYVVLTVKDNVPPNTFGPLQTSILVEDETVESFKEAIEKLNKKPDLIAKISRENLKQAAKLTKTSYRDEWQEFWETAISNHNAQPNKFFRSLYMEERYRNWYMRQDHTESATGTNPRIGTALQTARYAISDWISANPKRQNAYKKAKSILKRG